MSMIALTEDNFDREVLNSEIPVLFDFWASWCGPCRSLSPIVEEIAGEADGFKVGSINVDDEPGLARDFRVMSIPTLIVFKDGKAAKRSVGVISKEEILELIRG